MVLATTSIGNNYWLGNFLSLHISNSSLRYLRLFLHSSNFQSLFVVVYMGNRVQLFYYILTRRTDCLDVNIRFLDPDLVIIADPCLCRNAGFLTAMMVGLLQSRTCVVAVAGSVFSPSCAHMEGGPPSSVGNTTEIRRDRSP